MEKTTNKKFEFKTICLMAVIVIPIIQLAGYLDNVYMSAIVTAAAIKLRESTVIKLERFVWGFVIFGYALDTIYKLMSLF